MVTTFYEDAETLVLESLEALKLLQPGLQLDKDQKSSCLLPPIESQWL
jgi:hypothetical protein